MSDNQTIELNYVPLDLEVTPESKGFEIGDTPSTNIKTEVQTNDPNIVPSGGGSIVQGFLKSPNFNTNVSGWSINANGDAEFNGTIKAGAYTQIFRQDGIPTSLHINDLWIDTNDSNKLYVALSVGANHARKHTLCVSRRGWPYLSL